MSLLIKLTDGSSFTAAGTVEELAASIEELGKGPTVFVFRSPSSLPGEKDWVVPLASILLIEEQP